MKIKMKNKMLYPSCSEAVFRFHTTEPKNIQKIMQLIADEISANNNYWGKQEVPFFETAEEYDSSYKPRKAKEKILKALKGNKDNVLLSGCAGLGENNAIVDVNKKEGYFDLNIGNNDISPRTTGWTNEVQEICECEEAEGNTKSSRELNEKARDCCCGITYFK